MWEIYDLDQRRKNKREKQRRMELMLEPKKQKSPFFLHLKRVPAEIRIGRPLLPPQVLPANVLSLDLSSDHVTLFTDQPIREGTKVSIRIYGDQGFYVTGHVRFSKLFRLSKRIVNSQAFNYRIRIDFEFASPNEAQAVKNHAQTFFQKYAKGLSF